jgi:hypothetical protein
VSFNGISGTLPAISDAMTHLDVSFNNFKGGLHGDLTPAGRLMIYNVSNNPNLGPAKLPAGMPDSLQTFSAANVGLVGRLDGAALGAGLWHLDIAGNALEGPLPGGGGALPLQEVRGAAGAAAPLLPPPLACSRAALDPSGARPADHAAAPAPRPARSTSPATTSPGSCPPASPPPPRSCTSTSRATT